MDTLDFMAQTRWEDMPEAVQAQTHMALLDLLGVGIGGADTRLSQIIRDTAAEDMPGPMAMFCDGRGTTPAGFALSMGMTVDALDGHDGFNPAKGHIACPLIPAVLACARDLGASGRDVLTAIALGFEFGSRASVAQHATVPDYHTSGSWGAVTVAAACARLMGLDRKTTRHALGIAEYHGPRSQMMRCIDHPTMLKDGSGWGAMTGLMAVHMAKRGFTGAPAITVEEAPEFWGDLGSVWLGLEQYYKPYPVCRWAQAPVEGALALRSAHGLTAGDIAAVEVETFHESCRLATRRPATTEEAQYSTSFPVAIALVYGGIAPEHLEGDALRNPEVLRLSDALTMRESDHANENFPANRPARTTLVLKNGQRLEGDWCEPRWDARNPPSHDELRAKFHDLADPRVGTPRANAIENAVDALAETSLTPLFDLITQPSSASARSGSAA